MGTPISNNSIDQALYQATGALDEAANAAAEKLAESGWTVAEPKTDSSTLKKVVEDTLKTTTADPYSGDLQSITAEGDTKTVLLDSGLQAEIGKDGIKFSELNNGRSPLAWHSRPIGEVKFADLDKDTNSFSGDYGMIKYADGREIASYKTTPDVVISALHDALRGADGLDKKDQAHADQVLEKITPFVDISARGTDEDSANFRGMTFDSIQGDLNGKIELDYALSNHTKTHAGLDGDQLNFESTKTLEYVPGWHKGGEHVTDELGGQFTKIEPKVSSEKVSVDLSDSKNWSGHQLREVVDFKRLLDSVNPDTLTASEKTNFDLVSEKVDTALEERDPTFEQPTLQNISSNKEGEVVIDYIQGKTSDQRAPKSAVIKGDEVHVTYTDYKPKPPGVISTANVEYEDKTVVLDLKDIKSWTPKQMSLGSDLKAALKNGGDVELTGEQQQVVDNLLEKMDSVSAPKAEPGKDDLAKSPLQDLVYASLPGFFAAESKPVEVGNLANPSAVNTEINSGE